MDDHQEHQGVERVEQDFQQANKLINSRQRFQRRPKKAVDLINFLLARKGYGQTQSSDELHLAWQKTVGQNWHGKTTVGNIRRGVLEVIVQNSAALQQLTFNKKNLLKLMQDQLPQNKIQNIKFKVGKVN